MVMDGEGEGDGGGVALEDEENSSNSHSAQEANNVVQEVVGTIESVAVIGDYRRTQRKECYNLVRRMKLLLPLLEEIRDLGDAPIPEIGVSYLCSLQKALLSAKKLLKTCSEGSKLYLVLESEAIMGRFHASYDKISQALDGFPFEELEISDEVKEQLVNPGSISMQELGVDDLFERSKALQDLSATIRAFGITECHGVKELCLGHLSPGNTSTQLQKNSQLAMMLVRTFPTLEGCSLKVELMQVQLKRAKRRTETQDLELAMDMMVVLSKEDERNTDSAIIERLAKKLELQTTQDLKMEALSVRKIVRERGGPTSESAQQIIALLNKFNHIAGVEEANFLDNPPVAKSLVKSPSLVIPHEFLCPITLEIMTDPVIVASGQTYERESIQKWLDSNHRTCPKTRQALAHLSLAPNYALKNLILQWCEKNKFQLPQKNNSAELESSSPELKEKIISLVDNLSSVQLEVQRKAVLKIRMLSKENPENRILIANSGAIPPLVQLLSYPDSKIREHSVTALLNLSIDESNKKVIAREEAIPAIIEVLQSGTIEAKENSAAAIFSLSMLDENKVAIGFSNGIPPLVDLLKKGTIRGKKDALTALFNLSLNHMNKARAIEAGIVTPLLKLVEDKNLNMVDEALSILLLLASHPNGRHEIGQLPFIETLVGFMRDGTPKNKECATAVLFELSLNNTSFLLAALQYGVLEHVGEIARSGTNRAQRKANSLLQLMSKCEQIP